MPFEFAKCRFWRGMVPEIETTSGGGIYVLYPIDINNQLKWGVFVLTLKLAKPTLFIISRNSREFSWLNRRRHNGDVYLYLFIRIGLTQKRKPNKENLNLLNNRIARDLLQFSFQLGSIIRARDRNKIKEMPLSGIQIRKIFFKRNQHRSFLSLNVAKDRRTQKINYMFWRT